MPSLQAAPSRFHTRINRCNLPPWLIGSEEFQRRPLPLEIDGVKMTDRRLFERLARIESAQERGQVFHDYVTVKFRLHEWEEHQASARSSLRSSYVQFIHGWGADSNGHAGAVLKSWVEGRFGLRATYHHGRLDTDAEANERFLRDRMKGASKTMGMLMQLDLLYTFCQEELRRRYLDTKWLTLYRGTHDPEEYFVRDEPGLVELNNVSSFTSDPEVAWEFGSLVWKVEVPLEKIVFFSGLLPKHILDGESEYLVLGGEYRVKTLKY